MTPMRTRLPTMVFAPPQSTSTKAPTQQADRERRGTGHAHRAHSSGSTPAKILASPTGSSSQRESANVSIRSAPKDSSSQSDRKSAVEGKRGEGEGRDRQ